jgi:hypothetical protein
VKHNRDQENDKLIPHRDAERHANEHAVKQNSNFKHENLHDIFVVLLLLRQLKLILETPLTVAELLNLADLREGSNLWR